MCVPWKSSERQTTFKGKEGEGVCIRGVVLIWDESMEERKILGGKKARNFSYPQKPFVLASESALALSDGGG